MDRAGSGNDWVTYEWTPATNVASVTITDTNILTAYSADGPHYIRAYQTP